MTDKKIEAKLIALADELKHLIADNFLLPPKDSVHKRKDEIMAEVHQYGWEITWIIGLNLANLAKLEVEVLLLKPKDNMTPEEQKIYDEWFNRVNKPKGGP